MVMAGLARELTALKSLQAQTILPRVITHTDHDGLLQNTVTSLVKDRHGFLWVGTEGGLHCFDGIEFRTFQHDPADSFSLPNNYVTSLLADRAGRLWVGTDGGGLVRFDESVQRFLPCKDTSARFSNNDVICLAEDSSGGLWLGSSQGLRRYDPKTASFRYFQQNSRDIASLPNNHVRSLFVDPAGCVWAGTLGGLSLWSGGTFKIWNRQNSNIINDQVWALNMDQQGRLWVGTETGVSIMDVSTGLWTATPWAQRKKIRGIHFGGNKVWIATMGAGLEVVNLANETSNSFLHESTDLSSNTILTSYLDDERLLWLGTQGGGLNRLYLGGDEFTTIDDRHGLDNQMVWSFAEVGAQVWAGTAQGVYTVDLVRRRAHRIPMKIGSVMAMVAKGRTVWLGTNGDGLVRLQGPSMRVYRHSPDDTNSIGSNVVYALCLDRRGLLWVGTAAGLARLDPSTERVTRFEHRSSDPGSIPHDFVLSLCESHDGQLWVGTNAGVCRYVGPDFERVDLPVTDIDGNVKSGYNDFIQCFFEDTARHEMWIGTSNGAVVIDLAHGTTRRLGRDRGLPADLIYAIQGDADGNRWLSSSKGLSRWKRSDDSFQNFDISYGLQGNDFNQSASIRLANGEIVFGGTSGLTYFNPEESWTDTCDFPVVMTRLLVHGEEKEEWRENRRLEFGPDDNITFEFAALCYRNAPANQYRYGIQGVDESWIETKRLRMANYSHIKPGEYVFTVHATNAYGRESRRPATVRFVVLPPWWQKWWFRIALAMVVGGFVWAGIMVKVRRLKRQKDRLEIAVGERTKELREAQETLEQKVNERTRQLRDLSMYLENIREQERIRISREVHDQLGQQLTALKMDAAWIARQAGRSDHGISQKAEEMSSQVSNTIETVQRIAAELRPAILDNLGLADAMEWHLQHHARRAGLTWRYDKPEGLPRLPCELATAIFRVFQEALTNVIRHAKAEFVEVILRDVHGELQLIVRDDGVGIAGSRIESPQSLGLLSMRERLDAFGGRLSINGSSGKGTEIRTTVPLGPIENTQTHGAT